MLAYVWDCMLLGVGPAASCSQVPQRMLEPKGCLNSGRLAWPGQWQQQDDFIHGKKEHAGYCTLLLSAGVTFVGVSWTHEQVQELEREISFSGEAPECPAASPPTSLPQSLLTTAVCTPLMKKTSSHF